MHVVAVEHHERQAEALSSSSFHCRTHRRRRGNDDAADPLAHQQLADDQARLDRLAEADVVGDEQVDARQQQRLAQRLELVGVDPDAGAVRRLEQLRVGGGDGVPAQGVEVGRKGPRLVEPVLGDARPASPFAGCASTSSSQSTSSGTPCASSSRHERRTSVRSPPSPGWTSSTRYWRVRTETMSPGFGATSANMWTGLGRIIAAAIERLVGPCDAFPEPVRGQS